MIMMLGLAHKVKGMNLQPKYCADFRCETYRKLERETGVEYFLIDNIWEQK